MPFFDEHGEPLTRIFLVQRSPRCFQLVRPISFLEAGREESERVRVPAHDINAPAVGDNATDLASVPTFLWGLIASYGRQTSAALLHDHLSDEASSADPATGIRRRREADRLFGVALLESGVPRLRAWVMRAYVSIDKYVQFRRWQALLMVAHVALGVLSIYAAIGMAVGWWPGAPWWMLALVGAPAVSTALWWRDAVAMLVIIYTGVFLVPFMIVAALGQVVLLVLEGTVWLATGARAPAPVIGPTILARRRP
jgi:hypothetical protein